MARAPSSITIVSISPSRRKSATRNVLASAGLSSTMMILFPTGPVGDFGSTHSANAGWRLDPGLRGDGDAEGKRRSLPHFRFHPDSATVALRDAIARGQADARA